MADKVCVIVGAGPGNGRALLERFAREGYQVAVMARDRMRLEALARAVPGSLALACDVTRLESIDAAFAQVARELGPVDTLLYNAGSYVRGGVDTELARLEECLRVNTLGCLATVQQVVPAMRKRGGGAIVVVGASASRRGLSGVLPFATAKGGQRLMVEALARELGPQGIHVAYLVIDAVIDSPLMRALFPCRSADGFARPEHIASAVAQLVAQPRSTWTFELDLRPHVEKW
jgi:NAD(P)-dependent dehydrogenase (short-subunit alcohol dehydrogenase family)